jgi:hypothetical protein
VRKQSSKIETHLGLGLLDLVGHIVDLHCDNKKETTYIQ